MLLFFCGSFGTGSHKMNKTCLVYILFTFTLHGILFGKNMASNMLWLLNCLSYPMTIEPAKSDTQTTNHLTDVLAAWLIETAYHIPERSE